MNNSSNIHNEVNNMMLTTRRNTIFSIERVMESNLLKESEKIELIRLYLGIHNILNNAEYNYLNSKLGC